MTTLYGISNCDTVRKARHWLNEQGIDYRFHDLRRDGLDSKMLRGWERQLGWEQLLNRRGTTWRKLPAAVRDSIDGSSALKIMLEQPAIIKRPLLDDHGQLHLGFSTESYRSIFRVKDSA
ncbi:MAG: ArsC family reductase [Gammaproteobacteria bacterium]|nr:ArsC family reductase [Gammaproteobacteria bacterium]